MTPLIYGDSISGNRLKVNWTADHLGLAHDWVETVVLTGETRAEKFLGINPAVRAWIARVERALRIED